MGLLSSPPLVCFWVSHGVGMGRPPPKSTMLFGQYGFVARGEGNDGFGKGGKASKAVFFLLLCPINIGRGRGGDNEKSFKRPSK